MTASLREWRLQKRLTQTELAALLGISQVAVSKWEGGLTAPAPLRIFELARVLDVAVSDPLATCVRGRT